MKRPEGASFRGSASTPTLLPVAILIFCKGIISPSSSSRLTGWFLLAEVYGRKRRTGAGDKNVEWAMGEPGGGLGGELKGLWMRPFLRTFKNLLL